MGESPRGIQSYHSGSFQGWSKEFKTKVRAKSGGRCWYCGLELSERLREWAIDHVDARAYGGADDLENLVPSCHPCNHAKGKRGAEYLRQLWRLRQVPWPAQERISAYQVGLLEEMGVGLPLPPPPPMWCDIHEWLEARAQ